MHHNSHLYMPQVHDGVRYLPAATRDAKLAALQQERGGADAGFNRGRRDIPLTKPDDRAFTEKLAASVDAWLQVGSHRIQSAASCVLLATFLNVPVSFAVEC